MKQAKADAQELIDAYRAEKQQDFNNSVLAAGESHEYFFAFRRCFNNYTHNGTLSIQTFNI